VSAPLLRSRRLIRTGDPAAAAEAVARTHLVQDLDASPSGTPFRFEERIRGTHLLSLETTSCTGVFTGEVEPGSTMVIAWLKSGSGTLDGHPVPIGRPVLYREGVQPFRWESFQKDVLRIDRQIVEEVAAERGGWSPGPLEFRPRHVPEGPTLAAWWLMVRSIAAEVLDGPAEVSLERERELTRIAAGGLLTAIPHWPTRTPTSARFERAETFLLEHATEQIGVADIATAGDLSVRGLQTAFQRYHGVTPLGYMRRIRLLLARERLEDDPSASVAEVARSCGFGHLGRFSAAYREEFGELPKETRKGARRL
jgi:AraC-like DNA-binding protein